MKTVTIKFGSVDNATSFVKAIEDFESHFDLRIMERENEMPTIMKAISPYIAA